MQETEPDLLLRLRGGDEAAFAGLVRELHGSLVRVALSFVGVRAVAEEVAQDTWASVLSSLAAFEGRSSLRTWIFRICTNGAKTRAEREARSTPASALGGEDEGSIEDGRFDEREHWAEPPRPWKDDTPEAILERTEALQQIQRTLLSLPALQRAVITLRDLEGLDSVEACAVLEISEANQRVLLHRARQKVRRALEDLYR